MNRPGAMHLHQQFKQDNTMKQWTLWLVTLTLAAQAWTAAADDYLNVAKVKGIVFLKSMADLKEEGTPAVEGIYAKGIPMMKTAGFKALIRPYLGQPLTRDTMLTLQKDIVLYYRQHGRPIVDVLYPPQEVSNGVLHVILMESKLENIKVEYSRETASSQSANVVTKVATNGWTPPKYILDQVHLHAGSAVDMNTLQTDLDWLNRNPFRKVDVFFAPGASLGQSAMTLQAREKCYPLEAHVGYDNTGTRYTDFNRINVGFDWGKTFGLMDHVFTYQFVADPALDHLRAHTASYTIPLPWRHELRFMGYYLDVDADITPELKQTGASYQTSMRYAIPMPYIGKYQHEFSTGLDIKSEDSNLAIGGTPVSFPRTEIFQVAFGYTGALGDPLGVTKVGLQLYYSPGGVGSRNNDEAFQQARTDATADYVYGRLQLERQTRLPANFTWVMRGGYQRASGNLLPTEEWGLGGYATVRGYHEREVNTDNGWQVSNELRSPELSPLADWCKWGYAQDKLQLLAFFDYGWGQLMQKAPSDSYDQRELSSVGCGFRYTARKNLEIRFDYGWQLRRYTEIEYGSAWHLAATMRF